MRTSATLSLIAVLVIGTFAVAGAETYRHREMCPFWGWNFFQNDGLEVIDVDGNGVMTGNGDGYLAVYAPTSINGQVTGGTFTYTLTSAHPDLAGWWTSDYAGWTGFAFMGYYPQGGGYVATLFESEGQNTGWVGTWNLITRGPDNALYLGLTMDITSAEGGVLTGTFAGEAMTGTYGETAEGKVWSISGQSYSWSGFYGTGYHGTTASGGLYGVFVDDLVVPEPSSVLALLTGALGMVGFLRRKA